MTTDTSTLWLSQAHALLTRGDLPAASALFDRICESDPGHCYAWKMRGALNAQLGRIGEAVDCLRHVVALEPELAEGYYNLGNMLKMQDASDESLAYFRRAIELRPEFAEAHAHLGAVLHSLNKLPEARQSYIDALSINPDQPEIHYTLGMLHQGLGDYEAASANFQNVLRIQPGHFRTYLGIGAVLRIQGKAGMAVGAYLQALKINPSSAEAHYCLGLALHEAGRLEDAVSSFNNALRLDPNDAAAYAGLALVQRILGRYQEAVDNYRQALLLRPNDAELRYLFAAATAEGAPPSAPAEYVTKLFDGYAERFDASLVHGLEYRVPEQLSGAVRSVLGQESGQLDVLDLGCGTGLCGVVFHDLARLLVGVDLSPRMIDKARKRGIYDDLLVGDVTDAVSDPGAAFDLILAADVFIYVGELAGVFSACASTLRLGGLFAFSVEAAQDHESCVLQPTARYAHSMSYIRWLSGEYGFVERYVGDVVLRKDKADPVRGYIFVLGLSKIPLK